MFVFKKWFPAFYTFNGERIGYELKHLTAAEVREVRAVVVRVIGAQELAKAEATKTPENAGEIGAAAIDRVSKALDPEFLRRVFANYVQNVTGVQDETGARTDGPVLLEFADDDFLISVLLGLLNKGKVSAEEGKASGSPSTSGSEGTAGASASPATSTANAGGIAPSTATPTTANVPSGAPDQERTA